MKILSFPLKGKGSLLKALETGLARQGLHFRRISVENKMDMTAVVK